MTPDYMKRIWLAEAPTGVWSSGPVVIRDMGWEWDTREEWERMGWKVTGPYVLQEDQP